MEKTPKGKSKSMKYVRSVCNNEEYNCSATVPKLTNENYTPEKEKRTPKFHSDNIILCSQETINTDVKWDWDSPKNIKPKIVRKARKELKELTTLPPTQKKFSQPLDQLKNFEKLREELIALREEISRTDDCVPLSPLEDQTFKEEKEKDINSFIEEQYFHIENHVSECDSIKKNEFQELLDDSCDEALVMCTQMLEEKLEKDDRVIDESKSDGKTSKPKKDSFVLETNNIFKIADDSFDAVLKEFEDEDVEILSQAGNNNDISYVPKKFKENHNTSSFKRTFSDANVEYVPKKIEKTTSSKFSFHRTHSFESAATSNVEELPKYVRDEIERKRKEALSRLREKKEKEKHQQMIDNYRNISPQKCSPEEIEQKRLQAKAIREAKQLEIIEKNRLEALKRLERNKLKRLANSQTTQAKK